MNLKTNTVLIFASKAEQVQEDRSCNHLEKKNLKQVRNNNTIWIQRALNIHKDLAQFTSLHHLVLNEKSFAKVHGKLTSHVTTKDHVTSGCV